MVMNKLGKMQQLAFVTGGSGFVGGRLIEALVARGKAGRFVLSYAARRQRQA